MSAANDLAIIRGLRVLHPMAQVLTGPTEASRLIEELLSAFGERDAPPMTLQGIAKRAMDVMNASSLAKEEDAGCSFGRLIADHMPVASEHMDWSFVLFLRSGFLPYLTKQMPPHRRTIQDGWASHEIGPDPPRCPFGEALAVCPALAEAMITILPFPILLGDQRVQNVVWAMLQQRSRISSTLFCKVVEMASPEALNENRLGAASPLSFTMTNYNHARGEDRYRHAEDAIVFMERAVPDRLEGVDLSLFKLDHQTFLNDAVDTYRPNKKDVLPNRLQQLLNSKRKAQKEYPALLCKRLDTDMESIFSAKPLIALCASYVIGAVWDIVHR